jgi:hypothetical protein
MSTFGASSTLEARMYVWINETVAFGDEGKPCATYHYDDPFKSYFRGLRTPEGRDVVAAPPDDHPHHKGLQFGLCTSAANFWEESENSEPPNLRLPIGNQRTTKLPIGNQRTTKLEVLPAGGGVGFSQEVFWGIGSKAIFHETRRISVVKAHNAYIWTWRTTLIAAQDVEILTSVWSGPGYCGLGLRLDRDLFKEGKINPSGMQSGSVPARVSFQGNGAEVTFSQDVMQANALFLSFYDDGDGFAFMSLGPTNRRSRVLNRGERLEGEFVVTIADL